MPAIAEETLSPQEDRTIERFITFMEEVSRKRNPTGTIKRFNQGRAAGCVHAEFTVLGTLPPEHRVGLFAEPRTFAAWIRKFRSPACKLGSGSFAMKRSRWCRDWVLIAAVRLCALMNCFPMVGCALDRNLGSRR